MTFQKIMGSAETTLEGLFYPPISSYTVPLAANTALSIPVPPTAEVVVLKSFGNFMAVINDTAAVTYTSAGYQSVQLANAVAGGDATGLANDATEYTVTVSVDGDANAVLVVGSAAQTYTDLLTEINADLTGAVAALNTAGTQIVITSSTPGGTSSISIATDLLFLELTEFDSTLPAVDGSAGLKNGQQVNPVGFKISGVDSETLSVITTGTGVVITALFY